jgi:phage gp29-like protein
MINTLRAALTRISRAILKNTQAGARSAASSALNYNSVTTLDPAVLARAFAAADQGNITDQAALFELIEEQDAHIFGELSKRRRSVTGLGWQLIPPKDATEAELSRADELADMIRAIPNFEDAQYDLTDAIGKGVAALEIDWRAGEEWVPRELVWVPQRMFRLENTGDRAGQLQYLKDGIPEPLREFGWIVHEHRAKSGYIEAAALFRVLAWTYAYKAYNVRDMQRFLEVYGLPLRLGKYPSGLGKGARDTLLRAVKNIGNDGAGVVPQEMSIEFIQAQKTGTVADFLSAIEYWERKQSIAILGGTLTSQADGKTSTNALGAIHDKIRREIMLHDVRQIEPTISSQLLTPIALINGMFPADRMPSFTYMTDAPADQKEMVQVLKEAVAVGMKIDLEWAHKAMQIPMAAEDAEILRVGTPAPFGAAPNEADLRSVASLARKSADDAVSRAVARLSADAAPTVSSWIATLEAMLASAGSLEEFREMLLVAYPDLDADKAVEAMSQAFAALDLHGRADVEGELRG